MSDQKAGTGAHTEATRDPGQPLGTDVLGKERLVALYRISRELLSERAPVAVVERILSAAASALAPERACLLALAPDGGLRPLASHRLELGPEADRWPISLSVVRHVIETGLAVLASDIRGDASFKGATSIHRFRIRSVLAVPLGPRPVRGVLYLDTQAAERAFSAEDLDFATALAVQAALVLDRVEEHARTAEALARSDERLELVQAELLRHEIVGRSPALVQAYDAVRRFARAGARVLLRGETGTGKELFARAYAAESGQAGAGLGAGAHSGARPHPRGVRALRPRARRLHRGDPRQEGPSRDGRPRSALPRRDRGRRARPADQAPPLPRLR